MHRNHANQLIPSKRPEQAANRHSCPEQTTDALGQKKIFACALDDRLLEIEYEDALHPTPNVSLEWNERYPRLASMEDGIGAATSEIGAVLSESGVTEPLADRSFVYDPAGNRTEADEEPAWYNELNQLTGAGAPGLTLVSGEVNTPSTVKVDNEVVPVSPSTEFATEKDWPVGPAEFTVQATNTVNVRATNTYTYTYEVPPAQTFEYDANGNMISDGERTFEWDAENRLIAINYDEEGDERTEFEYDGFGRRVRIVEKDGETVLSDKWFVWDAMKIAEQRAADGETVQKRYFKEGFREGSNNYYYAKDHLGSIRAVVDASGNERGRWDYDEWGVRGENEVVTNPIEPDFITRCFVCAKPGGCKSQKLHGCSLCIYSISFERPRRPACQFLLIDLL